MENDYHKVMGLKSRAEAADVAKSQVHLKTPHIVERAFSPEFSFQYSIALSGDVSFNILLHYLETVCVLQV